VSAGSRHIPFERLIDLVDGRLSPAEQRQTRIHTAACSRCATQLAWLERVIGLIRANDYEEPPDRLAADISRVFAFYNPSASSSLRRRITAVLRSDSAQLPLSVGRRSGSSTEQQLLFTAETLDLEVRIAPSGSLWEVSGQVLNADVGGLAELQGSAGEVRATLNEAGEFLLAPVPPGQYTLILQLTTAEIAITGLAIGV
jgi:anti-sigma factor RsiW